MNEGDRVTRHQGAMAAGCRQMTELLKGNRQGVKRHIGSCLPAPSGLSDIRFLDKAKHAILHLYYVIYGFAKVYTSEWSLGHLFSATAKHAILHHCYVVYDSAKVYALAESCARKTVDILS
jgi:hypothetical protein